MVPSPARSFKLLACNYPPTGEQEAAKGTEEVERGGREGDLGKGRSSDLQRQQSAHNGRKLLNKKTERSNSAGSLPHLDRFPL